jgi:NAD(P) transhydrogenase
VKLVFLASDRRLIGAHILGEEATELIHIARAVLHNGGPIDDFINTTFNFPTRADAYKYAAYDGLQRLRTRVEVGARPVSGRAGWSGSGSLGRGSP